MSNPIKNVALVGAGGNLGPHVLKALLDATFNVTVITRESSSYKPPSSKVKIVRLPDSYPTGRLKTAFEGQDAVVCTVVPTTGPNDDLRFRLTDAAVNAGIRRYIPADFGVDENAELLKRLPQIQERIDVRNYCRSKESDTFSWTAVTTGLFYDFCLVHGSFGINVEERKARMIEGGTLPFSTSTMPRIGLAVVRILKRLEETKNRIVMIQSFTTTQVEVLKAAEKVIGDKFDITDRQSLADRLAECDRKREMGDMSALLEPVGLLGMNQDYQADPKFANKILGLDTESVEDETRKALRHYFELNG